jgi:hypothetical protein
MLCQVWRNIGYCKWEENFEVKDVSKEELLEASMAEEETSDCVVPMAEEPVKT